MSNKPVNQYFELAQTKPELILFSIGRDPSPELAKKLNDKLSQFKRIYCELGSGSGIHLIERAALDPEALYLGFEIRFKRTFRTAEKAEQRGLKNLLVIRGQAQHLDQYIPNASLDGVYVNFPDPWDKRRWLKHRMLNPQMLDNIAAKLKPSGFLSYKTDHAEYFEETKKLIDSRADYKVLELSQNFYKSEFIVGNVASEFEKLFTSKGLPIYYLRLGRK